MIGRFLENAERLAGRTAMQLCGDESLEAFTYGEVFGGAAGVCRYLRAAGAENHPVAILMDYDPYWGMVFFGIYQAGCCIVPLDTQLSASEVSNLVGHSGARIVFTDGPNREKLAGMAVTVVDARLQGLLPRSPAPPLPRPGTNALPPEKGDGCSDGPSPMLVLYTSGTTGDPKGVALSEANFQAELTALLEVVPVDQSDHLLSVLPLHHVLALLTGLLAPLYVGGKVTFLATVERTRVLRALQQLGVTAFVCVPQFFYLLLANVWSEISARPPYVRRIFRLLMRANLFVRRYGFNLGKVLFPRIHSAFGKQLRFFAAGGAYFDPAVIRDLASWGLNLVQAYGLTETSGACTATPLKDQHWGSVGCALRDTEVRLLRCNEEGIGEIAVRGPIVTAGYFRNESATKEAFEDGWFLTGDLGYRDAEGFYYVTGRLKEVIVLASGKNVYPEELERHYSGHPAILDVAVVARLGPSGEEQLQAIVVPDFDYLKSQKIANAMEVIRFEIENLAGRLPPYKRVTGLELRTEPLPRTTTRKLKRRELQSRVEKKSGKASARLEFDSRVAEEAYRFLAGLGRAPAAISMESNLELDLGLDSLQRVELLSHLEGIFGVSISQARAAEFYTLGDLVALVDPEKTASRQAQAQGHTWAKLLSQDEPFAEPFLRSRPVSHAVVNLLRLFFRYCLGRPLFKLRVDGIEHLPAAGPYLICPNHLSYLDGLFFESVFPRAVFDRVFYLGFSEYFQAGFKQKFAQWIHIVPLDPDTYLVRALRAGARGLGQGKILCIFPEGARSVDGQIKPFKQGSSILAREANVPIVPAAIAGTYQVLARHQTRLRLHPVRIAFGKPLHPSDYAGYPELTAAVEKAVRELFEAAPRPKDL